jgi:ribonucleoside-diphosphate reductase alpha chain
MNRRTLGIGVTNLAYYLAKNGAKYSDGSGNALIHKTFEALQYYSLKASNNLANDLGACPLFNETQYAQGILPIDSYKKDIDAFCGTELELDWDALRKDIVTTGLRNSTLTALMPCESSSQISNSTNGIEPPRGFVSIKQSKDGILKQIVPDYENLKDKYELLWDIKDNEGYLQLCAIMQKFVDQSISTNTHYDPSQYDGNKVPMKLFLMDLLKAYKYGVKTLYYHTTRDGGGDDMAEKEDDNACADGVCKL